MRSLILTILYLAKDTVHRWVTRVSSPLARVLVVFFLSLCAVCFLGTYVISAKVIKDKIRTRGADTVALFMSGGAETSFPSEGEIRELLGAESVAVRSVGFVSDGRHRTIPVYSYQFNRVGQFFPLLAAGGRPTMLCTPAKGLPEAPRTVNINGQDFTVLIRHLPAEHPLMRFQDGQCILVQPEEVERISQGRNLSGGALYAQLRLTGEDINPARLQELERYLRNYSQLCGKQAHITSAAELLADMDLIMSNQTQARAAFCLGIACIVGILLTALAGMEYRQNEYIYTLMKSFGIHPFMLVAAFIVENLILVALSFTAALIVFMQTQGLILAQYFKLGRFTLTLTEIRPEVELIAITLSICVLISSLPIIFAAHKDIVRVLN